MSTTAQNETIYYNSLFRHGVDEKRRVQIPAKWLPTTGGVEFTLILWPKAKEGPCLRVLPPQEMAELMASIDGMANSDPIFQTHKYLVNHPIKPRLTGDYFRQSLVSSSIYQSL